MSTERKETVAPVEPEGQEETKSTEEAQTEATDATENETQTPEPTETEAAASDETTEPEEEKPEEEEAEESSSTDADSSEIQEPQIPPARESLSQLDNLQQTAAEAEKLDQFPESEDMEAMISLYEESMSEIAEEKIIKGRIIQITEKEVIVDVGFKSEGSIPLEEFKDSEKIKVGDEIEVYLEKFENQEGLVVLSKKKADFLRVWDHIKDAYEAGEKVTGRLVRKIKGGVVVDLMGVDAFLPGSQIDIRQVPDIDALIGQLLEFKIIKLNKRRRNIVVSRRVVLEEERERRKQELVKEIEEGQVREGVVKNITDFGAFVDLGGIDGLLHITDMSWGRVSHPSELVNLGETIEVKILEFDRDRERISLGMKQLTPYPWEGVEEKYPIGSRVTGRVVSITDYGIFVELEKGVEGLIHISEMSWTRQIKHPSKVVSLDDEVEAIVLKVDKEEEKISLGMKQTEQNPWETLDERYPIGSRVKGKVRNITNFGVFVELEEGIDGLVHISDLSWTKRVRHPSEIVNKGEEVDVVVLNIDKENQRISLGLKQIIDDPWEQIAENNPVGSITSGKVVRLLDRGLIVELPGEIEGFVPFSHLGRDDISKPADAFSIDDSLPLKVIEIDPQNRRIVLSVKEYFSDKDQEEIDKFHQEFGVKSTVSMAEAAQVSKEDLTASTEEETGEAEEKAEETTATAEEPETEEAPTAEAEETVEETTADAEEAAEEASEEASAPEAEDETVEESTDEAEEPAAEEETAEETEESEEPAAEETTDPADATEDTAEADTAEADEEPAAADDTDDTAEADHEESTGDETEMEEEPDEVSDDDKDKA